MDLSPITIKEALAFCKATHRHLPDLQGAMWGVAVWDFGMVVGVAIVGLAPPAFMHEGILDVVRCAVIEGQRNACSMLYGSCSRAAKAMGASGLVTYTREHEPGTTLIAAGWVKGGLTDGRAMWNKRKGRSGAVVKGERKRRWWAPWSTRVLKGETL